MKNQGYVLVALGCLLAVSPLTAQNTNHPTAQPDPQINAPHHQKPPLQTLIDNLSAFTTLEAVYDFTYESSEIGSRYEKRQIVVDYKTGRYCIRSLHFSDPERKIGTGCSIEVWDGKQHVSFLSGLRNATFDILAAGGTPLIGSASVNPSSNTRDPLILSRLNFLGSGSLHHELETALSNQNHHLIEKKKLTFEGYEIELSPEGDPTDIRMLGDIGSGPEPLRVVNLQDYKDHKAIRIPLTVEVRTFGNHLSKEMQQARLQPDTIKVNMPLRDETFRFKLPPGTTVQDLVKNTSYIVPDDPEEFTGGPLRSHAPLGLDAMARDKQIWAKSLLGQKGPDVVVEKWLTSAPDLKGKFVLLDLWATWCGPCRKAIPELNEIQEKFAHKLTVIGISGEDEATVRAMKVPTIKFASAIDPQNRIAKAVELKALPHTILMDPQGIVRWEGFPLLTGQELTLQVVGEIIKKHDK